jgi:hypothetical protein
MKKNEVTSFISSMQTDVSLAQGVKYANHGRMSKFVKDCDKALDVIIDIPDGAVKGFKVQKGLRGLKGKILFNSDDIKVVKNKNVIVLGHTVLDDFFITI